MLENRVIDLGGNEVALKPFTGEKPTTYGFGLIYPETVQYIIRQADLMLANQAREGHDQSVVNNGVFQDPENSFHESVHMCMLYYVELCSRISRQRPFPFTKGLNSGMFSGSQKNIIVRRYDFLEEIGLIKAISPVYDNATHEYIDRQYIVCRLEPTTRNNG
jgi:hypothetical protein